MISIHLYNISQQQMKPGIVKHPYLGDVKVQISNNGSVLQLKTTQERNPDWFKKYAAYRNYGWKYCLFPIEVKEEEDFQFNSPIPKKYPIQKAFMLFMQITYQGYYVTSLRDQILTRAKNNAKFSSNEILYILYTIANAWREWKQFCKLNGIDQYFMAISSCHVLFNQQGNIKLITPFSSPQDSLEIIYFAPENLPPNVQNANSWNKSISFSMGLIGSQLITMKIAHPFYQYKGPQLKFVYDEYIKWIKFSQNNVPKEIFNMVLLLTDPNPWTRLKFGEFEAILSPYHDSILDGKQQYLDHKKSRASLLQYLKSKKDKVIL